MISRRHMLAGAAALVASTSLPATPAASPRIRRLSWAGIQLTLGDAALFIDPLTDPAVWEEALPGPLVPVEPSAENYVLITHRHPDHCDPAAIRAVLGVRGTLAYPAEAGPPPVEGVRLRASPLHAPQILGDFTATPVPAADGYGDPQVSWVVAAGGRRIFHGGDTQWHGHWWHVGRQLGPFDAAFLPINGARFSWRQPASDIPAVLTPEQAVAAAIVLGARKLVPIHYGVSGADGYAETERALEQVQAVAARRGLRVDPVRPGDRVALD